MSEEFEEVIEEYVEPEPDLTTPEGRRAYAISQIVAVGGVVLDEQPMADESDPHVVAGYKLVLNYPTLEAKELCEALQLEMEVEGLIPWTEAPQAAPEFVEWPYGYDEEGNPNPAPLPPQQYYSEDGQEIHYDSETETWRYVLTGELYTPSEV